MTVYLTTEDLLTLVNDLDVGPIRDLGLLGSATHRPSTRLRGQDVYPSIDAKAAALHESLVRNHPLVDGNKRLGWLATVVFYGMNGFDLDAPDDDAYSLVIAVAEGRADIELAASLLSHWRSETN